MFFLGLIVSLCYVPGVLGAYIATQWPLLSIVLPFALWRRGPFTIFHFIGVLFLAYAFVRIWYAPFPSAGVFGFWLVLIMGLSVWFGTTLHSVRELYAGLAIGASVSSMLAVAQHFGFQSALFVASTSPAGLYVNSVQQGTVLAIVIVALVSERMWFYVPLLVPGLLLSTSRGGMLALAVGLLGCFIRRRWVFAVVAVAGVALYVSPLSSSDQLRVAIWKMAYELLKPLGIGPGMFYVILMPWQGGWVFPEYAHNDILQLFFEYGAGALAPLAIFGFALSRNQDREWPVLLAFAAAACYSMPMYMPVVSFLACVALGRVLRSYALDGDIGGYGRRFDVPLRFAGVGGEAVSVASHNFAGGGK